MLGGMRLYKLAIAIQAAHSGTGARLTKMTEEADHIDREKNGFWFTPPLHPTNYSSDCVLGSDCAFLTRVRRSLYTPFYTKICVAGLYRGQLECRRDTFYRCLIEGIFLADTIPEKLPYRTLRVPCTIT